MSNIYARASISSILWYSNYRNLISSPSYPYTTNYRGNLTMDTTGMILEIDHSLALVDLRS